MKIKKKASSPTRKSEDFFKDGWKYLEKIGFAKKLNKGESFSPAEIRKIILESIRMYKQGKARQNFVLGIGSIIHHNIITSEDKLAETVMK